MFFLMHLPNNSGKLGVHAGELAGDAQEFGTDILAERIIWEQESSECHNMNILMVREKYMMNTKQSKTSKQGMAAVDNQIIEHGELELGKNDEDRARSKKKGPTSSSGRRGCRRAGAGAAAFIGKRRK